MWHLPALRAMPLDRQWDLCAQIQTTLAKVYHTQAMARLRNMRSNAPPPSRVQLLPPLSLLIYPIASRHASMTISTLRHPAKLLCSTILPLRRLPSTIASPSPRSTVSQEGAPFLMVRDCCTRAIHASLTTTRAIHFEPCGMQGIVRRTRGV